MGLVWTVPLVGAGREAGLEERFAAPPLSHSIAEQLGLTDQRRLFLSEVHTSVQGRGGDGKFQFRASERLPVFHRLGGQVLCCQGFEQYFTPARRFRAQEYRCAVIG